MYSVEKIMRIYDDVHGIYLEIRQNPDFPGSALELHTNCNKENETWYGKINLTLNKDHALALAKALTEMSETLK